MNRRMLQEAACYGMLSGVALGYFGAVLVLASWLPEPTGRIS